VDSSLARVTSTSRSRVEFAFAQDNARWPWQDLHPQHPVALNMYFYFAPITALIALELATPELQTALTRLEWTCPELREPMMASTGACTFPGIDTKDRSFSVDLWTRSGELLAHAEGKGVAFATRDFAAWRAGTKAQIQAGAAPGDIPRATPAQLGLGDGWEPFVSPPEQDGDRQIFRALVTRKEGFPPAHRFHAGSGDHVNVGHLTDCALQAAHLIRGVPLRCIGGVAEFRRYVELDCPFELRLTEDGEALRFQGTQSGHDCFELELHVVAS